MAPLDYSELCNIITEVLARIEMPVSLTLINTSLLSMLKMAIIDEKFLIENNDKFSLQIIGSDLKILLRQKREVKHLSSEKATKICSVIERDLRKLKQVEDVLVKENKREILFDDFISNYNTNKKSINIAFIVRNSHTLEIFCTNQQTYVKFVNKNSVHIEMDDKQIFDILKSNNFEVILLQCLKSLLSHFFVPINLGSLQCCFSLGNVLIDKDFLMKYSNIFQGSGEAGIQLKHDARKEIDEGGKKYNKIVLSDAEANTSCQEIQLVTTKTMLNTAKCELTTAENELISTGSTLTTTESELSSKTDNAEIMQHIHNALKYNKSLVVVGDGDKDALLLDLVGADDCNRLLLLKNMQHIINMEIEKMKE